jgi:RNA polymerase subunit RPABC4/transcription elongation factor Spt4
MQEDMGVRYCPGCGREDKATDWREFGKLVQNGWVLTDDTFSCPHCGRSYAACDWNNQVNPPSKPLPDIGSQSDRVTTTSPARSVAPFIAMPLLVLFVGISIGFVAATIPELPWNQPVRDKAFSFDRITALQEEIGVLRDELFSSEITLEDWQKKARDLLAVEQVHSTLPLWNGKTLVLPANEGIVITNCRFNCAPDSNDAMIDIR